MRGRAARAATGLLGALTILALGAAPSADGYVYWNTVEPSTGHVGRANLNGSSPGNLISGAGTYVCGVAVDEQHVYWSNRFQGTIGRANLNGSGVTQSFITGASEPCGIAVNDTHIYWANLSGTGPGKIGRADIDGNPASVNQSFIADTGGIGPCDVVVDGQHIYWDVAQSTTLGSIGRADLDGNPASINTNFIPLTGSSPCGVDVNATHVFWAAQSGGGPGTVGRANLDGSSPQPSFIPSLQNTCGVAVDSGHVYWADVDNDKIGRADLDGNPASVNTDFITGPTFVCDVAVDTFPHTTAMPFTCSPVGIVIDQTTTCTVTATDTGAGPPSPPPGNVAFSTLGGGSFGSGGSCPLSPIGAGQSRCSIAYTATQLFGGTHDLTASYPGEVRHLPVSTPEPVAVRLRDAPISVSCSPAAVAVSQTTSCRATVADGSPGSPSTPFGTLALSSSVSGGFPASGCDLAHVNLTTAACNFDYTPARHGTHTISASWPGDFSHDPSLGSGSVVASALGLGGPTRNRKRGTATLPVHVPGPGSVDLSGAGIAATAEQLGASGEVTLPVAPTGNTKRRLKRKGAAAVQPTVTFTPAGGGDQQTASAALKLVKKR